MCAEIILKVTMTGKVHVNEKLSVLRVVKLTMCAERALLFFSRWPARLTASKKLNLKKR